MKGLIILNIQNIFVGVAASLLACTGAAIFVIDAANLAGFSQTELITWIFSIYFFGGLASLFLTLKYKMPLIGAHSLTAAAFLSASVGQFNLPQLAGSYIIAGLIIIVIGMTGIFTRLIDYIPVQLINAMLAGLLLKYVITAVPAIKEFPLIGISSILGFLLIPLISKKIPNFIGALLLGTIVLFIVSPPTGIGEIHFVMPQMVTPSFSIGAIISLSFPIALLILSNETAVALSSLKKNGFKPPVRITIFTSGIVTTFAGFFGGHAAGVGGMTTALCSSQEAGEKEKRYWAAIVSGILIVLFGVFAWATVSFIELLPRGYMTIMASFALLGILAGSLHSSFSGTRFYYSTTVTLLVSLSGVSMFQISSAVWALIFGVITSKVLRE